MIEIIFVILAAALRSIPAQLPPDVVEIRKREVQLPIIIDPKRQENIKLLRLFVSADRGKTWAHVRDIKPTVESANFSAPRDDLYWLALQVVYNDGRREPGDESNLAPSVKVFVNGDRRPVRVEKTYSELLAEVERLSKPTKTEVPVIIPSKDWVRPTEVRPDDLGRLIDRADRLEVRAGPHPGTPLLFESVDRKDLDALKAALKVTKPARTVHCMCDGTPAIELYAQGKRIGRLTNHHAVLLRCDLWNSDAPLADPEPLLRWFDARKIPGPRKEYDEARRLEKEADAAERKWLAAMPPALKPHWAEAIRSRADDRNAVLRQALAAAVLSERDRIQALFAWYGSGEGPWSGYPAYENIAENLLLDYATVDLLAAIDGRDLSPSEIEGVARLFAGFTFNQARPNDNRLLPADLKARLLKHSLATGNEDRHSRAKAHFSR